MCPSYPADPSQPANPLGFDPSDPLVTPPWAGIEGWFGRVTGAIRRSWRPLLIIVFLTQVLPAMAIQLFPPIISTRLTYPSFDVNGPQPADELEVASPGVVLGLVVLLLVVVLVVNLLQAVGYAGGTWLLVRGAAGAPASIGDAFRYGARRMAGLFGWTLLYGVIVALGMCLCVLPGVYFGVALALFGPVYLFEGGNPIGRAWTLFHNRFGPVLGRLALLIAAVFGLQLVPAILGQVVLVAIEGVDTGYTPTAVGINLVVALANLPTMLILLVGLVVTYTECRAWEGQLNTENLARELT